MVTHKRNQALRSPQTGSAQVPQPLEETGRHGEPLIRLRGVVKYYPTAVGKFQALKGIDLDIFPGEFLGIYGKSGAGKTTLINMLTGIDHLSAGQVWMKDIPVHTLDEDRLALWRGLNLGIIYQSVYLMPTLNLVDNVLLPMDLCGLFQAGSSQKRALE